MSLKRIIPSAITAQVRKLMVSEAREGLEDQAVELIAGMPAAPEPCCLAGDHWTPENHPRHAIGQLKVNGIRALYLQNRIVTRQAQPLNAALHCLPGLQILEERFGQPMVIDGEYFSRNYETTLAEHQKGYGEGVFWVFDAVPYSEWKRNSFTKQLEQRLQDLAEAFPHEESFIAALGGWDMDERKAMEVARSVWSQRQEGLVIKDARSLYTRGRSKDWLKLKKTNSGIGTVIDVSFKGATISTGLKHVLVKIGDRVHKVAAMKPEVRDALLADRNNYLTGRQVAVQWADTTSRGNLQGARVVSVLAKGD